MLSISCYTQDTVSLYLDNNFNRVEKSEATYEKTAIIANGDYYITDKNMRGQIINYCEYKSINPWIEDGYARHYSEPGKLYSCGKYIDGKISGVWVYYIRNSIDTVYYSVIKKFTSDTNCPNISERKINKKYCQLKRRKIDSIKTFLHDNFCLPARTLSKSNHFKLDMRLTLDSDGRVKCPEVENTIDVDLTSEILRALSLYKTNDNIGIHLLI